MSDVSIKCPHCKRSYLSDFVDSHCRYCGKPTSTLLTRLGCGIVFVPLIAALVGVGFSIFGIAGGPPGMIVCGSVGVFIGAVGGVIWVITGDTTFFDFFN